MCTILSLRFVDKLRSGSISNHTLPFRADKLGECNGDYYSPTFGSASFRSLIEAINYLFFSTPYGFWGRTVSWILP